jgi:hypothetical protein
MESADALASSTPKNPAAALGKRSKELGFIWGVFGLVGVAFDDLGTAADDRGNRNRRTGAEAGIEDANHVPSDFITPKTTHPTTCYKMLTNFI